MEQQAKIIPISAISYRHGSNKCSNEVLQPYNAGATPNWVIDESKTINWWHSLKLNVRTTNFFLIRNLKRLLFFGCLGIMVACKKEDGPGDVDNIPGLGGDAWVKGPVDHWIYDSLTKPYNIAVKYKWDQFELSLNKTLVPPKEEKIIPAMNAVKKVWINTYVAEAGEIFIKKYCPKFFVLAGSASYNTDGTITLGTAEGGRKVVIYMLNNFRTKTMDGYTPGDSANVKQLFHTIEHEFGHILHQTTMYPQEFKRISVGLYTANWNNVSDRNARRDGFVTAYSMSAPDEDFVEMISMMLVEGKDGFDAIVNGIPAGTSVNGITQAEARNRLRQKEAMVVAYFKEIWSIDFYSLQTRTRTAVVDLIQ